MFNNMARTFIFIFIFCFLYACKSNRRDDNDIVKIKFESVDEKIFFIKYVAFIRWEEILSDSGYSKNEIVFIIQQKINSDSTYVPIIMKNSKIEKVFSYKTYLSVIDTLNLDLEKVKRAENLLDSLEPYEVITN